MGYAPGAQPQQVGYGNPPQNHMRPHSTGMSSNPPTERPTSANGSEKLRRMFNGVDRNGKWLILLFLLYTDGIMADILQRYFTNL